MKLSEQEVNAILKLDEFKRYQYFIKRIADNELIYTMKNSEDQYAISEIEDQIFVPFWSAKEFAKICLTDEWQNFIIVEISLDDLEEELISFLNENDFLMNIFPIQPKTGFVVDVSEFTRDLNDELENYS